MQIFKAQVRWKTISLGAWVIVSLITPQVSFAQSSEPGTTNSSGFPEETLENLVIQVSDMLVEKIDNASCEEAVDILDKVKESSTKPVDADSFMGKILNDIKTNPKLKGIISQKVGGPLLNRLIDCNMVPLDLLAPENTAS